MTDRERVAKAIYEREVKEGMSLIDYTNPEVVARQNVAPNAACDIDGEFGDVRNLMHELRKARAALLAAETVSVMLENCMKVLSEPDEQLCCSGRECGCYGATTHQEALHYAEKALSAYREAVK